MAEPIKPTCRNMLMRIQVVDVKKTTVIKLEKFTTKTVAKNMQAKK